MSLQMRIFDKWFKKLQHNLIAKPIGSFTYFLILITGLKSSLKAQQHNSLFIKSFCLFLFLFLFLIIYSNER
jgi:hypothetical protein